MGFGVKFENAKRTKKNRKVHGLLLVVLQILLLVLLLLLKLLLFAFVDME